MLAFFALSATAKSSTAAPAPAPSRKPSQIYALMLEDRQPCIDNSSTSTCPTSTNFTPCGDGTWCYFDFQCGVFLGQKGCCKDGNGGAKNAVANQSCSAKMEVLGNMTWTPATGNVSTMYPTFSFCTSDKSLPSYQLIGSFTGSGAPLAMGPDGQVCCPSVLDSVEYYAGDDINPSKALCFAPAGMNLQNLLTGGSSGSNGSSSGGNSMKPTARREFLPLLLPLLIAPLAFFFA